MEYYRNIKKRIKRVIKNFNKLLDSNEQINLDAHDTDSQTPEVIAPKKGDLLNY